MEYAIRYVYDPDSSEQYDAALLFENSDRSFAFRKDFHVRDRVLLCCACHERATISLGSRGKMHFKHFPNTPDCELKDVSFSREERQQIEQHFASKESPQHKFLKNAIGKYLANQDGMDISSINVDNRFLKHRKEKRRPDIFCEFTGHRITFEIQLSKLPPKYIFKRQQFYEKIKVYLVWVLNDFDPSGQSQTEKDIKYLNVHQNFFYFDDAPLVQSLSAHYKKGSVNSIGKPHFKWTKTPVLLKDLTFDQTDYQCYVVSYAKEQLTCYRHAFRSRHPGLMEKMGRFFIHDDEKLIDFFHPSIKELYPDDLHLLENALGLNRNIDLLLKAVKEGKPYFLLYLLERSGFSFRLSHASNDSSSLLEQILLRENFTFRWRIVQLLFHNGYTLTGGDRLFIKTFNFYADHLHIRSQYVINIYAYQALKIKSHIEWFEMIEGVVYTILSAKLHRIVGHGFVNFIGLANNAIDNYQGTFSFIERSFKRYGIWDVILAEDRNKTFDNKYQAYRSKSVTDTQGFFTLRFLFPEVLDALAEPFEWIRMEDIPVEMS